MIEDIWNRENWPRCEADRDRSACRTFRRRWNSHRRRRQCHRGSNPPGAGAAEEAADPRSLGRTAGRSGQGRRRRRLCSEAPQPGHPVALQRRARGNRDDRLLGKPNIDLEINGTGTRRRHQHPVDAVGLQALGKALTKLDLERLDLLAVAGGTDAVSGEACTIRICPDAARTQIKRYLTDKFSIASGSDLVTVGYGKTKLKDPANPMAEANRRVQVVNSVHCAKLASKMSMDADVALGKSLQHVLAAHPR